MPWFRAPHGKEYPVATQPRRFSGAELRHVIEDVIRAANFYIGPGMLLEWEHAAREEISWEIYNGRLLHRSQTRSTWCFEAWNIFQLDNGVRSAEPLLALKLDQPAGVLHVTRAIYCRAWEGYLAGANIYLSREVPRWVPELVGTILLASLPTLEALRDELICRLFQAVVGISRLPLTSIEAPLPAFALGELAYFCRAQVSIPAAYVGPWRTVHELIAEALSGDLSWREQTKLLEIILRAAPPTELEQAAKLFVMRWQELDQSPQDLCALLRNLFNDVSLSPWTDFADKAVQFVQYVAAGSFLSAGEAADFFGLLLRNLCRHLTAYDLITFHHRGANYPDALLLDSVLKHAFDWLERHPDLYCGREGDLPQVQQQKRLRRRGLRQAWLLRRFYEGLPVPDAPTSPGENARILPAPHRHVPEEQIVEPSRRSKRLFDSDPLSDYVGTVALRVLRQSIDDLGNAIELRELGMALFLDRPLGRFKEAGAPGQTSLLSYEGFSRLVARRRLEQIGSDTTLAMDPEKRNAYAQRLADLEVSGLPVADQRANPRPDVVSLEDAHKAAGDFVLIRTTRTATNDFLQALDIPVSDKDRTLEWFRSGSARLIVRQTAIGGRRDDVLVIFDCDLRRRLELRVQSAAGYRCRGGQENPAGGLKVMRTWDVDPSQQLQEHNWEEGDLVLHFKD